MTRLGAIAADVIGAGELAAALQAQGLRTTVLLGPLPDAPPDSAALVVVPASPRDSLAATQWLGQAGCRRIFVHLRATGIGAFGPLGDALIAALGCGFALVCPAAPAQGITIYQGHLFTGAAAVPENLVRSLSAQTEGTVGLLTHATVARGPAALRGAITALREQGRRYAIIDAVDEAQLRSIAAAAEGQALVAGGTGLAMALAEQFPGTGAAASAAPLPPAGAGAILAGSGARATLFQIGAARRHLPTLQLPLLAMPEAGALAAQALAWAAQQTGATPCLIAAAAPPDQWAALEARLGRAAAAALSEETLAQIAAGLVAAGTTRLLVAGSAAAASVAARLRLRQLTVAVEIEPGLSWLLATTDTAPLLLALKPGRNGSRDCFVNAFEMLPRG